MATNPVAEQLTPNAIRKLGIKALTKELGPVDMVRFIRQFDPGEGDYTKERESLLGDMTMDDIMHEVEEIRAAKNKNRDI